MISSGGLACASRKRSTNKSLWEGSDGADVGSVGGISGRPALHGLANRTYVGGYFDVEFRNAQGQDHEFRFHRFVPFFYADLHERIRFAAEVEIEDGSDVAIEFAYLDLLISDEVNFRGGVILDPLGWFNLYHDSPINNFTDRPLVNQFVIPTTLREIKSPKTCCCTSSSNRL